MVESKIVQNFRRFEEERDIKYPCTSILRFPVYSEVGGKG